jgi:hypothetical protein
VLLNAVLCTQINQHLFGVYMVSVNSAKTVAKLTIYLALMMKVNMSFGFTVDGFKETKLGMKLNEVIELGYNCTSYKTGKWKGKSSCNKFFEGSSNETIGGLPVNEVVLDLNVDGVYRVLIRINNSTLAAKTVLTQHFGLPKDYITPDQWGTEEHDYYWIGSNGASYYIFYQDSVDYKSPLANRLGAIQIFNKKVTDARLKKLSNDF